MERRMNERDNLAVGVFKLRVGGSEQEVTV
jgi:hypothetical protein